jgi:hypothetical protein
VTASDQEWKHESNEFGRGKGKKPSHNGTSQRFIGQETWADEPTWLMFISHISWLTNIIQWATPAVKFVGNDVVDELKLRSSVLSN